MPDNSANAHSPSYRLAALDRDFLLSDAMRGTRFMLEYEKVEQSLKAHRIVSTIVVFGSARLREGQPGRAGRSYEAARRFAFLASKEGGALSHGDKHHVITTGGGPGIMEAANRGAMEAGAPTIGLNITLPHEQEPNAYSTPDLTFKFHYFAMRKMHLAMRAAALVVFPGGFGTLDELFEVITLQQTGKAPPCPVVLYDRAFWEKLMNIRFLAEEGLIAFKDLDLFHYAETPEELWGMLKQCGLKP